MIMIRIYTCAIVVRMRVRMIRISITLARAWVAGGVGSFPPIQCPGGCLTSFRIDPRSFNAAVQQLPLARLQISSHRSLNFPSNSESNNPKRLTQMNLDHLAVKTCETCYEQYSGEHRCSNDSECGSSNERSFAHDSSAGDGLLPRASSQGDSRGGVRGPLAGVRPGGRFVWFR